MDKQKLIASLEAMLFIHGEPLDLKRIIKTIGRISKDANEETIKAALAELAKDYESGVRGLKIIFNDKRVQLTTKPELSFLFEEFIKEELSEELTPAALETLSIIAYGAPLSRAVIDYVRGVNSTFILRILLLRGLISREADPQRSNAYLYQPSFDFLKHLGLARTEELPEYGKFRDIIEKLKPQT